MNKIFNFLLFVLLILTAFSCGKKVECPDFDQNVFDWFPYAKNDTIILERETKDTSIALFTESTVIWHTTHYMTNLDCGNCWDEINIGNYNKKSTNLYINVNLDQNQIVSEEYFIMGSFFSYANPFYFKQNNYLFFGTVYNEVKVFENANTDEFFTRLIISKNQGIIGLEDKKGFKWLVQKGNLIKPVQMEISNRACD